MQSLSSNGYRVACCEMNLILQCAQTFLSGREDSSLEAALVPPLDWLAVEHRADCHSMMPLMAYVLQGYGGSLVPQKIRERLHLRLLRTAQSNLAWLGEWRRMLLAFEASGIRTISLKGPGLSLLAYRNIALREFTDLDLLIRPADALMARDVLVREGYILRSPLIGDTEAEFLHSRNRQLGFVRDRPDMLIELHWGALHEMYSFQLPVDQLFKSAQVENQEGISFLSLSREHLFLYLCAHGTKHCWRSLRWLCDVASLVRTAPELDWNRCIQWAEDMKCDLVLKHSLLLAQQALGLELPLPIRTYCDDAKARALADTAASFLLSAHGNLGYREELHYLSAFAKDWRDRIRFMFERVFIPAEQDWQEVRLPCSLRFLYYTVRPLRFMRDRVAKV